MDLLPKLRELSNLECRVFLFLTTLANFKREPLGMVECESISDLARTIGVGRKSFYRAIAGLTECGLVTRPGRDTCVVVTHYLCHEDATPVSLRHTPVSSGHTKTARAPKESTVCKAPIRSEEVSEEETEAVAAELTVKKKPRKAPSWLVWDPNREVLTTRNGDTSGNEEFMKRWKERLGEEDIIWSEKEAAEKWLRENPEKRIKVKRFDMFFGKWLEKRWEAS